MLIALLVALPLLALYAWTRTPTVTSAFGSVDGGELAAATLTAGVPHPPGSPFYLVWSRIMLVLPAGEPAARLALGSGLAAALAATFIALLVLELPSAASRLARASVALGAGWLLGLDPALWRQAVVAEVYALALALLALLLWLAARWQRWHRRQTLLAGGLALGLGLGVQLPILAAALGCGALVIAQLINKTRRRGQTARAAAWLGLGTAAGLLPYGILPVLGSRQPTASWGDWTTLAGMGRHISGAEYRYLVGAVPWQQWPGRISYALGELVGGLGPWGLGLGAIGLAATAGPWRAWRWLSGGLALGTLGWAISYGGADSTSYLLPLHLLGALWAGIGGLIVIERLEILARRQSSVVSRQSSVKRASVVSRQERGERTGDGQLAGGSHQQRGLAAVRWLLRRHRWLLLTPLLLLALVPWRMARLSLRTNTADRDLAQARLAAAPPAALLLTARDEETFPLWYLQAAAAARPDVQVLDGRLWAHAWYRRRFPCASANQALDRALRQCGGPVLATQNAAPLLPGWTPASQPGSDLLQLTPP